MSALAKLQPGDLVALRRGQSGSASGMHLVLEQTENGVRVQSFADGHSWTVPLADVAGLYPSALPPAATVSLEPRPEPKVEPAPRRPEPTPGRPETVYVIHRSYDVELWSRYFGRTVHYAAGAVVGRRRDGQLVRAFEGIDSHDVDQFMHDLQPQAYLPGHEPAEFAPTASDDDRPEPDRRPLEEQLAVPLREPNPSGRPPAPQSGAPRRPRSGAPGKEN
jgi:hypothetical protein